MVLSISLFSNYSHRGHAAEYLELALCYSRKFSGSIPDEIIGFFQINPILSAALWTLG
jgi:hypothetical protein